MVSKHSVSQPWSTQRTTTFHAERHRTYLAGVHTMRRAHPMRVKGNTMAPQPNYVELQGHHRDAAGAKRVGDAPLKDPISVTITVRRRPGAPDLAALSLKRSRQPRISREEFAATYGADPADLRRVAEFAANHGLMLIESSAAKRTVRVTGTVGQANEAFKVALGRYQSQEGEEFRGREGAVYIPAELKDVITGVFGLDNRKMAEPLVVRSNAEPAVVQQTTPKEVAGLYDFPAASAAGETVAIFEFGGGYQLSDIQAYFTGQGLPVPHLVAVSVDGQQNNYGGPSDNYTVETNLDIDVVGSVAVGANIVVYFAPWSEQGWIDIITTAIHDTTNRPSVISASYAWPESLWPSGQIAAISQAFQDAAALGVTVFAASGDHGSTWGQSDGKAHVGYPASDPYVTGVGGTTLNTTGNTITAETTWTPTGGGVSDVFGLPDYQGFAGVPKSVNDGHVGRGVPDIGGQSDPNSGYMLVIGGANDGLIGGTSAATPLFAALTARINAILGEPVGILQPNLYAFQNAGCYRPIEDGANNGSPGYTATTGASYNCCTGVGVPDGNGLLTMLQGIGRPPALTVFKNQLLMAWKGIEGDDSQWYTTFNGSAWAAQKQIPGIWSSTGPSLAVFDNEVVAAWKGMHFANVGVDDQRLWYTTFNGSTWTPQQTIGGSSSVGPSLAVLGGKLYAAWKGMLDDERLWYSSFDGTTWAPQQQVPHLGGSGVGPAAAVFDGKLYLVWKGIGEDHRIFYITFDGTTWSDQQDTGVGGTSDMVGLAVYNNQLHMAWKGIPGDQRLWHSSWNGTTWAPQQQIPNVLSSVGPQICAFGNDLYATWKGAGGDERIWYTTFNGTTWGAQQVVAGVATSPDLALT
jgi:kumamolisin